MNVLIDSFGWIEYFGEGPLAGKYAKYIEKANQREYFTPSIVIYEVYKKIKKEKSEEKALEACAYILAYTSIVYLTEKIALEAAENAEVITGDPHFKGIENVEFLGE